MFLINTIIPACLLAHNSWCSLIFSARYIHSNYLCDWCCALASWHTLILILFHHACHPAPVFSDSYQSEEKKRQGTTYLSSAHRMAYYYRLYLWSLGNHSLDCGSRCGSSFLLFVFVFSVGEWYTSIQASSYSLNPEVTLGGLGCRTRDDPTVYTSNIILVHKNPILLLEEIAACIRNSVYATSSSRKDKRVTAASMHTCSIHNKQALPWKKNRKRKNYRDGYHHPSVLRALNDRVSSYL